MKKETQKKKNKSPKTLIVKKKFNRIHVDDKVIYQNMRAFKGNRKDTNLLNINFKTRVWRVLQQMHLTKQINLSEVKAANDFKRSPPSFESLVHLIYEQRQLIEKNKPIKKQSKKNNQEGTINAKLHSETEKQMIVKSPNILMRLKRLFHSSQIVKRIYENEGTLVNKLLMLKYVEAMRYTVIGSGEIVKWKQFKNITEPK